MIIQSQRVWIASQFVPMQLHIENEKIIRMYPYGTKEVDTDYGNHRIVPGFIDTHIHGGYGYDTNDGDVEGMRALQKRLVEEGVTSFLPTTVTQSKEVLTAAVASVAEVEQAPQTGARIVGIHFEGPYLNVQFKGAQPEEHIIKPTVEEFKHYQAAAKGLIKVITLAPEQDDDFALTRYLAETGVVASIGHSAATYQQAIDAVANGAKSFTHVYNGMSRFGHRELNLVGSALRFEDVYGEIIVDGNHSSFDAVNVFMRAKGKERVVLITDALVCKGAEIGSKWTLGGHPIYLGADGAAYLEGGSSLAGSTLKSNDGVRNILEKVGLSWDWAIAAASSNPARLLGLDDRKGYLRVGYDADFVVLNDQIDVMATYVMGHLEFQR
ncbi:MAG TPA: N-acetylglucosamine-6-phosphate deacetylase [Erysipelothrix sp.]|nr:N-acetylglucosamine-6-phosphate deacetylase [Erysipelothrix sp.]